MWDPSTKVGASITLMPYAGDGVTCQLICIATSVAALLFNRLALRLFAMAPLSIVNAPRRPGLCYITKVLAMDSSTGLLL